MVSERLMSEKRGDRNAMTVKIASDAALADFKVGVDNVIFPWIFAQ
ncbi:MAG: hypothetical protein HC795_18120, partial [Coleofasciculaceae cyanobacterium RL_1_1]|nr:hypothetical protein [Coleofasciculaceae cyanobacterium RL_1_1]